MGIPETQRDPRSDETQLAQSDKHVPGPRVLGLNRWEGIAESASHALIVYKSQTTMAGAHGRQTDGAFLLLTPSAQYCWLPDRVLHRTDYSSSRGGTMPSRRAKREPLPDGDRGHAPGAWGSYRFRPGGIGPRKSRVFPIKRRAFPEKKLASGGNRALTGERARRE
jgi:hypothetical protein